MAEPHIDARFDLIYSLSDIPAGAPSGVQLARQPIPAVPSINDVINIKGNPYRVIRVGWALPYEPEEVGKLYAYISVQKAAAFTVENTDD